MASFHILHWMPDPRLHIFNGYSDVIETLAWGLRALGHEVTYSRSHLRAGSVPIVLGAQLMPRRVLADLPDDAILYNLEQLPGLLATGRTLDDLAWAGRRFTVWDYSAVNLETWGELGGRDALHLPVAFAPILSRIRRPDEQDIDVLLYGAPSASRFAVLADLCARGMSAMFFCGLYGEARDALIARAKLVLCLTSNAHSTIFSIVRAAYLLANRKAVIADLAAAEADMVGAVAFAARDQVAGLCRHYLDHEEDRSRLEEAGYAAIARRDVRAALGAVLSRRSSPK